MEVLNYEVVIIGGGPSGATVGKLVTKRGISCCIIDKEVFPRPKLCAGVLTGKTIELLKSMGLFQDINTYYNNSTNKFSMYYLNELVLNIETNTPFSYTNRIDFDNILIKDFLSNGGILYDGTKISDIDLEKNELLLSTNKKIRFKYIIGADGANSSLHRFVDKNYKPNGFCVEIDVPRDKTLHNSTRLYFGEIKGNYGWVFPKEDRLTVGFGGLRNRSIDYKEEFNKFIKIALPEYEDYTSSMVKGHYLPFGNYVKVPMYNDKLLLVGDAAGLVDPITGEGIYFALLSGKLAAETLIDRLEGRSGNLNSYIKELKVIQKIIDEGVFIQKIFYNKSIQRALFKNAKGHDNIAGYVSDNLVSYYNYRYKAVPKLIMDYKSMKRNKMS
ncbi:MAG: geranylgeranyl reductase family protein [Vulcanibacillus sp.]